MVLSLFDTDSTVNLISESMIKSSEYLSILPIMNSPDHRICNTSREMLPNKFIELCFRVKDDYILHTTLVVSDFGLSTDSANYFKHESADKCDSYQFVKYLYSRVVFTTESRYLDHRGVKCILPKALRSGDFISKPFRRFTNYLP